MTESQGVLIGVTVLWQFRQILETFDTGRLIQGRPIWKLSTKNTVYMRKCFLQNLQMSETCWACFNRMRTAAAAAAKSLQSCPNLCDFIDGSPPGSPVPGILQARTLAWVAISFSNA